MRHVNPKGGTKIKEVRGNKIYFFLFQLSFTASCIDTKWQMKTPILATVHMEERHTQSVIAAHLGTVATDWQLQDKISACVHDGAANIKESGERNKWTDVSCTAHKLQLCVNSAMGIDKVTNNPISNCVAGIAAASRLVGHFAHSPMAVGELKKRQEIMCPEKQPKKLIQHCKTRWNSTYAMFDRLVELRCAERSQCCKVYRRQDIGVKRRTLATNVRPAACPQATADRNICTVCRGWSNGVSCLSDAVGLSWRPSRCLCRRLNCCVCLQSRRR